MTTEFIVRFPGKRTDGGIDWVGVKAINFGKHDDRWLSIGPQAKAQKSSIKTLLEASRHHEDPDIRNLAISVNFLACEHKDIGGHSFELAVALADKIARLHPGLESSLIATGTVGEDLAVGKVDGFPAKVEGLLAAVQTGEIQRGSIFAFPRANMPEASGSLSRLQKLEIRLLPLDHLAEGEALWNPAAKTAHSHEANAAQRSGGGGQWLLTLLLLAGVVYWLAEACLLPGVSCRLPITENACPECGPRQQKPLDPALFQPRYTFKRAEEDHQYEYPLNNGQILHSGDQFKLHILPPVDSYVYLYYLDGKGRLWELLEAFQQPHAMSRNTQELPLPSEGRSFTLDNHPGRGELFLLVFLTPDTDWFTRYQAINTAWNHHQYQTSRTLQEELLTKLRAYHSLSFHHHPKR